MEIFAVVGGEILEAETVGSLYELWERLDLRTKSPSLGNSGEKYLGWFLVAEPLERGLKVLLSWNLVVDSRLVLKTASKCLLMAWFPRSVPVRDSCRARV